MAKEAYYFSHDSNARQDEKILMLRAEHGWEGYGIYWALIEMMFESSDTALHHNKIKGIAVSYNIDITLLQQVINTCIAEGLFTSDSDKFWSESLARRKLKFLDSREKKSEAGKKGMAKRYGKQHSNNDVITEPNKVKESKVKEIKVKEINKTLYGDFVQMTSSQYDSLINDLGQETTQRYILSIDDWFAQDEKRLKKYSDHSRMVRTWKRNDDLKGIQQTPYKNQPKSKGTQPTEIEQLYQRLKKEEQNNEAV